MSNFIIKKSREKHKSLDKPMDLLPKLNATYTNKPKLHGLQIKASKSKKNKHKQNPLSRQLMNKNGMQVQDSDTVITLEIVERKKDNQN